MPCERMALSKLSGNSSTAQANASAAQIVRAPAAANANTGPVSRGRRRSGMAKAIARLRADTKWKNTVKTRLCIMAAAPIDNRDTTKIPSTGVGAVIPLDAFAVIGIHRWFHTVEDTLERTDARLLVPVLRAHQRTIELLVKV